MIEIPHIDGKIWNVEQKIVDIITEYRTQDFVDITMDDEGSDISKTGLYDILDYMNQELGLDKSKVLIRTCNQVEEDHGYTLVKSPPLYIPETQKFVNDNSTIFEPKALTKTFGCFVGRGNWIRLAFSSYLYSRYADKTIQTYHYDRTSDYHQEHIGLDELVKHRYDNLPEAIQMLDQAPLTVDDLVDTYPILSPAHLEIFKVYKSFFVELVLETFYMGDSFYPTEKTWRPIVCKTPFIVHGPKNFIKNLHRVGFKTFDRWWNESYNELDFDMQIDPIIEIINNLASKNNDEIIIMYGEMQEILEHNYNLFMSMNPMDFNRIFDYE